MLEVPLHLAGQGQAAGLIPPGSATFHLLLAVHIPAGLTSWLPPALRNADGRPQHHDGTAPLPGVWYVGLRWLTHRASGNFLGFPTDAATIADAVVAHLAGLPSPPPPWPQQISTGSA
jgi:hypothetical protein